MNNAMKKLLLDQKLHEELKVSAKARKKRNRRDKLILRPTFGAKQRCLRWYREVQANKQEKQRQKDSHLYGAFA